MFGKGDVLDFSLQEEGASINIVGKEVTIWESHFSVTPEEIKNFETGDLQIGAVFDYGVLLFLFKLGNNPWVDLVYSYHYTNWLYKTGQDVFIEPSIEYLEDDEPLILKMYLMDTGTKTVVGKRIVELPHNIKTEMLSGLKHQKYAKLPFINSTSNSAKLQAFQLVTTFIQQQPIQDILNNLELHTIKS